MPSPALLCAATVAVARAGHGRRRLPRSPRTSSSSASARAAPPLHLLTRSGASSPTAIFQSTSARAPQPTAGSCGVPGLRSRPPSRRTGRSRTSTASRPGQLESGFTQSGRRLLGVHGHRRLRRQAEGRRPAASSPISIRRPSTSSRARAPASRASPTSKGKRVSLDEPGSGTLVDARIILARVRTHREGHQRRIPEAQPGRRQDARRRPRRVLLRRRLSDRRHLRARVGRRRHRPRAGHRARGRPDARAVRRSSRPTPFPPTRTRASTTSRRSPSARSGSRRPSSPMR